MSLAHFGPGLQLRKSASSSQLRVDKGHPTRRSVAHAAPGPAPGHFLREPTAVPAVLLRCDRRFVGLPVMLGGPAAIPSKTSNESAKHCKTTVACDHVRYLPYIPSAAHVRIQALYLCLFNLSYHFESF